VRRAVGRRERCYVLRATCYVLRAEGGTSRASPNLAYGQQNLGSSVLAARRSCTPGPRRCDSNGTTRRNEDERREVHQPVRGSDRAPHVAHSTSRRTCRRRRSRHSTSLPTQHVAPDTARRTRHEHVAPTWHVVRSTQHQALSTQHAARSTQHVARPTCQSAAL
jgi:hypothetical protein